MKKNIKKFQRWIYLDYGYHLDEFDTLEEALLAERYTSDFYITQKVDIKIEEVTNV